MADTGVWVKVWPDMVPSVSWATIESVSGTYKKPRYEFTDSDGDWVAYEFTDDGSVQTTDGVIDLAVVGGGGSGGARHSGGGGAGGMLLGEVHVQGKSHDVKIGTGGARVYHGSSSGAKGNAGNPSGFGALIALGGGGGPGGSTFVSGDDGGSGGGRGNGAAAQPGKSLFQQGNDGSSSNMGGGGGAGSGSTTHDGGNGVDIGYMIGATGSRFVAAGGGGGTNSPTPAGVGGSGVGGNGSNTTKSTASPGATNSGSGGGGNGYNDTGNDYNNSGYSGAGGSGIVVVRVPAKYALNVVETFHGWDTYATVTDGVVTSIERVPDNEPHTLGSEWVAAPDGVQVGWDYVDGVFSEPTVTQMPGDVE